MTHSSSPQSNPLVLQAQEQEKAVLHFREQFFEDLLGEWSRPPEKIDELMGQADAFYLPDFANPKLKDLPSTIMIRNAKQGVLAASVTPPQSMQSEGGGLRWVYSIMQAGDWLRYGILIQGDPKLVLSYERHHDHVLSVERIWDRQCDYQFRDSGGLLLEWRFHEPEFYSQYMYRERFKIIARHLHFRLGRIMSPIFEEPSPYGQEDADVMSVIQHRSGLKGNEDLSSTDSDTAFGEQ